MRAPGPEYGAPIWNSLRMRAGLRTSSRAMTSLLMLGSMTASFIYASQLTSSSLSVALPGYPLK